MNTNALIAELTAFDNYVANLLEDLYKFDNATPLDQDGVELPSERETYYDKSREARFIREKYEDLMSRLEAIYPDIFYLRRRFYSDGDVVQLESVSRQIKYALDALKELESRENSVNRHVLYRNSKNNSESSLEIYIDCDSKVQTIYSKLESFYKIYAELCRLFDISTSQFPLRIEKMEVNSLLAKLFGESKIVALLTKFFEESAAYVYRNHTPEGKRKGTTLKVEELRQVIQLENELKKNNFDTSEMREHIQISSQVIAKEYQELLSGNKSVSINGQSYNFSYDNPRGLFAEPNPPKLLNDANQDTEESE